MAPRNSNGEWSDYLEPTFVNMKLIIEALHFEWSGRRILTWVHNDLRDAFDLKREWLIPRRNGTAVNVPACLHVKSHVEPGLLPTHVVRRIRDSGHLDVAGRCTCMRTRRHQGQAQRLVDKLERPLANAVVLPDLLVGNPPALIESEDRWVSDPHLMSARLNSEYCVVRHKVSIKESELRDHPTTCIGQKWKVDTFGGRELAKDLRRVVADADQPNAAPLQLVLDPLQLN